MERREWSTRKSEESIQLRVAFGLLGLRKTKNGSAANGKADDAKTAASAFEKRKPPVDCAAPPTPAGWWR